MTAKGGREREEKKENQTPTKEEMNINCEEEKRLVPLCHNWISTS